MTWPKQSYCTQFYGDPRGKDFDDNLTGVAIPWLCVTSWDGKPYKRIQVHKRCAESLTRIFAAIWEASGHSQDKINEWGMNKCGGGYAFRSMRGGTRLSMHSYGCAVDFDPDRNAMGDATPHFAECQEVRNAFHAEGWVWGGNWSGRYCDGMHFQAALV